MLAYLVVGQDLHESRQNDLDFGSGTMWDAQRERQHFLLAIIRPHRRHVFRRPFLPSGDELVERGRLNVGPCKHVWGIKNHKYLLPSR